MIPLYEERRKAPRYQLSIPCLVSCSEVGASLFVAEIESLNISRSGVCLKIDTPLACGLPVKMDFVIENNADSQPDYTTIYVSGRVTRSMKASMAVRFDESYQILNLKRKLHLLHMQESWMKQFLDTTNSGEETYLQPNLRLFRDNIQ